LTWIFYAGHVRHSIQAWTTCHCTHCSCELRSNISLALPKGSTVILNRAVTKNLDILNGCVSLLAVGSILDGCVSLLSAGSILDGGVSLLSVGSILDGCLSLLSVGSILDGCVSLLPVGSISYIQLHLFVLSSTPFSNKHFHSIFSPIYNLHYDWNLSDNTLNIDIILQIVNMNKYVKHCVYIF
jgi:hypothetical protein